MGAKPRVKAAAMISRPDTVTGIDGVARCFWAGASPLYTNYHDAEWGMPVDSDIRLFEKICLEGFQSGLSWLTILQKRERFREVFAGFDPVSVACFGSDKVTDLLSDAGIIRHRGKIESTINNAQRAIELREEFGSLAAYFWRWQPPQSERPVQMTRAMLGKLGKTPTSVALSKDLRKRGWRFVGPTTAYAFMQAMGLVNDHVESCPTRALCLEARRRFTVPS